MKGQNPRLCKAWLESQAYIGRLQLFYEDMKKKEIWQVYLRSKLTHWSFSKSKWQFPCLSKPWRRLLYLYTQCKGSETDYYNGGRRPEATFRYRASDDYTLSIYEIYMVQ